LVVLYYLLYLYKQKQNTMKQLPQTELIELFTMLQEIKQTLKDYKHVSKYLPTELVNQLIDIQNETLNKIENN